MPMLELLSIGGWFAAPALKGVSDIIVTYLKNQYQYGDDIKENLEKLKRNVVKCQATVIAAEKYDIENIKLTSWLTDLRKATLDAEDVLDKVHYNRLKHEVGDHGKTSIANLAKRLFLSDKGVKNLEDVVKKFELIASEVSNLLHLLEFDKGRSRHHELVECRRTTSSSEESQICGREEEIQRLLLLLTSQNSAAGTDDNFSVILINGIAGIGKTMLAQYAYNDLNVKNEYDFRAWVYVSHKFDVNRITVDIIESGSNEPQHLDGCDSLDKIQKVLTMKLIGKRFLIVLDDVWTEEIHKWKALSKPFKSAKKKSIVLVTTREASVAKPMGVKEGGMIRLRELDSNEFKEFFKQCAFGDENPQRRRILETIAEEIAEKLNGSPLAAKTVSRILKSKLDEEKWRTVNEGKLWQLEQKQDDIMPVLKLSYDYLPGHLKQCFAYFSLYPKRHVFEKETLIQIWISLGFVVYEEGKSLEDIAMGYLTDLFNRSFLQDAPNWRNEFTVPDIVHDLAELVSANEHFRIECKKDVEKISVTVLHIYVTFEILSEVIENFPQLKRLRSLIIASDDPSLRYKKCSPSMFNALSKRLPHLRVLVFPKLGYIEVSDDISKFENLRNLEVPSSSSNKSLKISEKICCLYHLQFLNLGQNEFPKNINKLINLRYLNAELDMMTMINGIGTLNSLTKLQKFIVSRREKSTLKQLQNLNQLKGRLRIEGLKNAKDKEESSEAMLQNKKYLTALELIWNNTGYNIEETDYNSVFEGLQPHPNLRELMIEGYPVCQSPDWFKRYWQCNLEVIHLKSCSNLEDLSNFQPHFLRVLKIQDCKKISGRIEIPQIMERIAVRLFGKRRCSSRMNDVDEIVEEEQSLMFQLHIDTPPLLMTIFSPEDAAKVRRLSFWNLDDSELDTTFSLMLFESLTCLKHLHFKDCGLKVLPNKQIGKESLAKLRIQRCPNITSPVTFHNTMLELAVSYMSTETIGEPGSMFHLHVDCLLVLTKIITVADAAKAKMLSLPLVQKRVSVTVF